MKRSFTLIELLVVVAIIAILAAIALPNFIEAQARAKISRIETDMRTAAVALEAYQADENAYPTYDHFAAERPPELTEIFVPNRLTSPVAYLTTLPKDIFNVENLLPVAKPTFQYRDIAQSPDAYREIYNRRFGLPLDRPVGTRKWLLNSYGPDLIDGLDQPDPNARQLLYDPTNGTVSLGDVTRFGP